LIAGSQSLVTTFIANVTPFNILVNVANLWRKYSGNSLIEFFAIVAIDALFRHFNTITPCLVQIFTSVFRRSLRKMRRGRKVRSYVYKTRAKEK
jgi:hypothetical protein